MGIHIIKMPDIGEGIAEVEVVAWHVQPGDTVAEDQMLAEVMTDKATVEIPSPVVGKVLALGGEVGQLMAVGGELVRIEVEGAGNQKTAAQTASPTAASPTAAPPAAQMAASTNKQTVARTAAPSAAATSAAAAPSPAPGSERKAPGGATSAGEAGDPSPVAPRRNRAPGSRPLASPAVRRRAWDLGIELQFVPGSGEAGIIRHEDLDAFLAARQPGGHAAVSKPGRGSAAAADDARDTVDARNPDERDGDDEQTAVPVIGLRRRIAQKMQESKRRIPHYSYVEEVDVTELERLRDRLNQRWGERRGKLTLLPLLLRALVVAVREHPEVNAVFDDEAGIVTRHRAVHAGIATQTPAGLVVPVLRHAGDHDLWSAAAEIARLAESARASKALREELVGSTITLTSLGALGGIASTPVINHPEVAIVGVNRIVERPVVRDGTVVIRKMMNLSSSFDHRVVDGMDAARFIQAIRGLLECPALLFVDPA